MNPEAAAVANLPDAPRWGLFLGQFGQVTVVATLLAFLAAFIFSVIGEDKLANYRRYAFYLGCLGVIMTFGILASLFVTDQFEFASVFNHSSKVNPLHYKISSVWTMQQGSFLLWALYSAILAVVTVGRTQMYERWFTATFAAFLASIAGIIAKDSPFKLLDKLTVDGRVHIPTEGSGMPPGLQNYWNVIHPPIIFLGFACLSVPFAYGVAAMLTGNAKDWIKLCRAPVLFGVSILGLGISLGGLWAYETQGWGGFWGWDPVENVSLVPWLFLVALAHGIIVQTARGVWTSANLFLSGMPFVVFCYGTFLTRSGLLDKVSNHSFADMDNTAKSILRWFVLIVFLGFMTLFFTKGIKLGRSEPKAQPASGFNRASFYQLGAMSLCLLGFVIALGFSWPVITALRGGEGAAVEPTVYHRSVFWFFAAIMTAMGIAPFVSWKREGLKSILGRFVTMASLSMGAVGLFLLLPKISPWGIRIESDAKADGMWKGAQLPLAWVIGTLLFFCMFVAITNLWRSIELSKRSKLGIGPFIAHLGIAVLMAGLIISKGLEQRGVTRVSRDEIGSAIGYTVAFKSLNADKLADRDNVIKFDVKDPEGKAYEIDPNMYFTGDDSVQSWPFIRRSVSHDIYFFIHKPEINFWDKPLTIAPGETKTNEEITVQYLNMTHEGQLGQPGVKFIANMRLTTKEGQTFDIHPSLTFGEHGPEPSFEKLANINAGLLPQMDANTKTVTLQLYNGAPRFPVEIFYKPLTCLVYIGTAIFTIGGLMSAVYRRLAKKSPEGEYVAETATMINKDGNAPLATA